MRAFQSLVCELSVKKHRGASFQQFVLMSGMDHVG